MKLLDRHLVKELAPTFFFGVVLFAGFIWIAAGPLLRAITYLSMGLPWWIVAQIAGAFLPPMIVLAFPMAMLIAVIIGVTRLSSESEAVVMFASGISFYRMLVPILLFALGVTAAGLAINNYIVPAANSRIAYIEANVAHELRTNEPMDLPYRKDKTLIAMVHAEGGFDQLTNSLLKVTIVHYDAHGKPDLDIYGDSANWKGGLSWEIPNASVFYRSGLSYTGRNMVVNEIRQSPTTLKLLDDPDNYSFSALKKNIAEAKRVGGADPKKLREAEMSLWEKIALPCASFIFALVGAPLALRPQRAASRGAALGWGVLIILGYYAVFKYLDVLGSGGHVQPALAAFLPNIIGMIFAGYLIARVTT